MRKAFVLSACVILLASFSIAAVPRGLTFGDMTLQGGRLMIDETGEKGEFVSNVFEAPPGKYYDSVTVDALQLTGEATLLFEYSFNDFDTVAAKQKIYIRKGENTYNIDRRDIGQYRRIVLKANGRTEILTIEPHLRTKVWERYTPPVLFVAAIISGLGIMWWKKRKDSETEPEEELPI